MSTATVDLTAEAQALAKELTGWRRELHRHPELGFEEDWTSAYLQKHLQGFDLELHPGIAKTGIVGMLRSPNSDGSAVLLRADMDALPIQEVEGRSTAPRSPARCTPAATTVTWRCCSARRACSIADAATLAPRRGVLFPARRGGHGRRRSAMIEEGVLDLVEVALGLRPAPVVRIRRRHRRTSGPARPWRPRTSSRRVIGAGAGTARCRTRHVDPIVAAAHAVTALQSIVSRSVDPIETAVVTVGRFTPEQPATSSRTTAELVGTIRSFTPDTQEIIRRRLREVLEGSAAAMGCELDLDLRPGYPAMVNDAAAVGTARTAATPVFGADRVLEPPPIAAAEDFSYFLQQRPGAFVFVGSRNEARGIVAPHHSPEFDLDEEALPLGCALLASLAFQPDAGRAEGSR